MKTIDSKILMNAQKKATLTLAALLTACGGSIAGSSNITPSQVTGNVMMGPTQDALVAAYPIKADGTIDTSRVLASALTDKNGDYQLTIAVNEPIAVQTSGGNYVDEASGKTVIVDKSTTLTTVLPTVNPGQKITAAVNGVTDMAYQSFQAKVKAGLANVTIDAAVANANYSAGQAFGITDPVGVAPANTFGTIKNDDSGKYAMLIASMSKAAANANVDSHAIFNAYAAEFVTANGDLSKVGAKPVQVAGADGHPVNLTPPSMTALGTIVTQVSSGTTVMAGVKPPAGIVPPTMSSTPPKTAPVGYRPGDGPSTTTTATPTPTATPAHTPTPTPTPTHTPTPSPSPGR